MVPSDSLVWLLTLVVAVHFLT